MRNPLPRAPLWLAAAVMPVIMIKLALAQTNTGPLPPIPSPGVNLGAFGSPQFYIDVGTLVIGTLITAGLKKWGPSIPRAALPFLATGLAIVAGALATVTVGAGIGSPMDVFKIVALALGNVTIRELKDQIKPEPAKTD